MDLVHVGGMNTNTEQNRKLAETLRSLSLEPSFQTLEPPVKKNRRLFLSTAMLALGVSAIAVAFFWPDIAPRLKAALQLQTDVTETYIAPTDDKPAVSSTEALSGRASPSPTNSKSPISAPEITGSGFVVAQRVVTVFSKYEGEIASVGVRVGDKIEAGQVIVGIDDVSAHFSLEQAKADSEAAKLVLEGKILALRQADSSLQRNAVLSVKSAVSVQIFEEAKTARDTAVNAVDQARQSYAKAQLGVKIAQEHVDALVVRAPISGTVTRLDAHVGGRVLARVDSIKENESLMTITDTKSLVIDADIAETNIGELRPGLRGEAILDGFPNKPFAVEILQLWPVASAEKGTITLRLALLNPPEGTMPNMAARIRISTASAQQPGETPR